MRAALLSAGVLLAALSPAFAETCRLPGHTDRSAPARERPCPVEQRVVPYDPDRVANGRAPGFVDLGNGTEVRIGGRVRVDQDVRGR